MKTRFLIFAFLIFLTGILSIAASWIIQLQTGSQIDIIRGAIELAVLGAVLYLLWGRTIPAFVIAGIYAAVNLALSGFAFSQYLSLCAADVGVPLNSLVANLLVVIVSTLALFLLLLDYLDYRTRRVGTANAIK